MKYMYQCSECEQIYDLGPELMLCPDCSRKQEPTRPLRGVLEVKLEGQPAQNWQPRDLLPVESEYFPAMPVGDTPLWEPYRLRKALRFPHLFIKDDTVNPTGSLKDRASFLVAAFARQHGLDRIVVASTGNAASSMAGVGAATGLEVTIFLPVRAPRPKMVQALHYGATLIPVNGNYDRAYELSLEFSRTRGGFNRNTAYNPLTIEGKKTVALEIIQQLGQVPDYIFVPTGDGVILSGVFKGFRDLISLGLAPRMPTVVAVQAEGSNALYRAYLTGDFAEPVSAATVADSICVDVPRNGYHALKQLKTYGGTCISVSDRDILAAQCELARTTGLFAEPAGATALAGFLATHTHIPNPSTVCLLITGHGLKDIDTALKSVKIPRKAISRIEELP